MFMTLSVICDLIKLLYGHTNRHSDCVYIVQQVCDSLEPFDAKETCERSSKEHPLMDSRDILLGLKLMCGFIIYIAHIS